MTTPLLPRRRLLAGAAALFALPLAAVRAHAASPLLPTPASLAAALADAAGRRRALVVLASTEGCPWCKLVRENYLVPLRSEGQPVVEIDMVRADPVADFRGAPTTQREVAQQLKLRVAPTVLFIGPGGRELAQRITGVPLPDFYGAYLQERLDAANRAAA